MGTVLHLRTIRLQRWGATGGAPLREDGGGSSSATPEEEPADQPATPAVPLVVLQEQAPPVSMVVLGDVEEAANAQGMTHEI